MLVGAGGEVPGELKLAPVHAELDEGREDLGLVAIGQGREGGVELGAPVAEAAEALRGRGRLAGGGGEAAEGDQVADGVDDVGPSAASVMAIGVPLGGGQ